MVCYLGVVGFQWAGNTESNSSKNRILSSAIAFASSYYRNAAQVLIYLLQLPGEFSSYIISVCSIACNKIADGLAAYGASVLMSGSDVTVTEVPVFAWELVSGNLTCNGM
jgi:hypothetical protein